MSSILEDPAVRRAVHPLSVDFYHQAGELGLLDENVELLEGTLITRMSKSPLHESIVWLLFELLERCLPSGMCLLKETPLTLQTSEPEPDLAVVRGSRRDFRDRHPTTAELVVEVAISTVELDRRKASIYAAAGVREYWVVVPQERVVEVYGEPQGDRYARFRTIRSPERLESLIATGCSVDLAGLFAA